MSNETPHTVTESDFEERKGGLYYIGPLEPAIKFVQQDHGTLEESENGRTYVNYDHTPPKGWDDCAEFGVGETPEEAWRYIMGAVFGPLDEEFHPIPLEVRA
jgi:hypothetical protein